MFRHFIDAAKRHKKRSTIDARHSLKICLLQLAVKNVGAVERCVFCFPCRRLFVAADLELLRQLLSVGGRIVGEVRRAVCKETYDTYIDRVLTRLTESSENATLERCSVLFRYVRL